MKNGFSLIELLITVAVAGVLATIAIPSFVSYLQTRRLVGASQNLYYTIQFARSEAIRRNAVVYVSIQTGSNWCYGVNVASACSCNSANSCGLGAINATNTNLSLSATGLAGNSINFEPSHGAANAASTFTYTGNGLSMTVQVQTLGNTVICSSQIPGYQACT